MHLTREVAWNTTSLIWNTTSLIWQVELALNAVDFSPGDVPRAIVYVGVHTPTLSEARIDLHPISMHADNAVTYTG